MNDSQHPRRKTNADFRSDANRYSHTFEDLSKEPESFIKKLEEEIARDRENSNLQM